MNNKIVISWISYNNDFKDGIFNFEGPNASLHENFINDYDKHLWLISWNEGNKNEEIREAHLKTYLHKMKNKDKIQLLFLSLIDPTNENEIRSKLENILLQFQEDEIDLFVSPGTPSMMLTWYLMHISMGLKTRLFKIRNKKFRNNLNPLKEYIEIEQNTFTYSAVLKQSLTNNDIIHNYLISPSIEPMYNKAICVARSDNVTALIYGESGTGKEHLAKYIHENSARSNSPFITVNCSAYSDQLLESRLFGFKKGSFTGADKDQEGLFEAAENGTVFLDEIGDISAYLQQSLLRVLQQKEITKIGENKSKKVNVRIIAATNKNLPDLCMEGKFRWDLYYRLAVIEIELPSLRERGKDEIEKMTNHFLKIKKKIFKKNVLLKLNKSAKELLYNYPFPGNIRELENIIESCYVYCDEVITENDLPKRIREPKQELSWKIQEIEKNHILKAFKYFKGNKSKICNELGYGSLNTLYKKIKDYKIE